jgi:hypothetical protein
LTPADCLAAGQAALRARRLPNGSWPYREGQRGQVEPTLLAAAAGEPLAEAWLAGQRRSWPMLLLPAVAMAQAPALSGPVVDWILSATSEIVPGVEDFDATLPGWGWVADTAPWVEPTAAAVLSLARAGGAALRVGEGRALLRDRQCADGGWNYGNPAAFGVPLDSEPGSTAWACMALGADPAAALGRAWLRAQADWPGSRGSALAALALLAAGEDAAAALNALCAAWTARGLPERSDTLALGLAALLTAEGAPHPFFTAP